MSTDEHIHSCQDAFELVFFVDSQHFAAIMYHLLVGEYAVAYRSANGLL